MMIFCTKVKLLDMFQGAGKAIINIFWCTEAILAPKVISWFLKPP